MTTTKKKPTKPKAKKFALENDAPKPEAHSEPPKIRERATPSAMRTRDNLQKLADGAATEGEKQAALAAIERLSERWDFANPIEVKTADIFAGMIPASVTGYASDVMTFEPHESLVASFTKWAIEHGFGLRTRIRKRDGAETIAVEAEAAHIPRLKTLAETIRTSFVRLWQEFQRVTLCDERDCTVFMRGCYDGCMSDPRRDGERLPSRSGSPQKPAKGKALAAKGVALHPYSVGVEMGEKIRFQVPTDEIAACIHALAAEQAAA